jgi:hypothetical protein
LDIRWALKFIAKGISRIAASNPSNAVCKPIAISPRLIFLKIQAPSHTRPIKIAEPVMNKLLFNIVSPIYRQYITAIRLISANVKGK